MTSDERKRLRSMLEHFQKQVEIQAVCMPAPRLLDYVERQLERVFDAQIKKIQ